jgi:MoxR-like ATPase
MPENGHVLMDSQPGLGKTTIAKALARIKGGSLGRFQGTSDITTSDIQGNVIYKNGEFEFIPGPIFSDVVLADEINRSATREQSALVEPLEEGQVTVNGVTYQLPSNHLMLATLNDKEIEKGVNKLTVALKDRFAVSLKFPPYDADGMVKAANIGRNGVKANTRVTKNDLEIVAKAMGSIVLSDAVSNRAANIIISLRTGKIKEELDVKEHEKLRPELDAQETVIAGARPLIIISQFAILNALKNGQSEVYDTDIDRVAKYVLSHRITPAFGVNTTFEELYDEALQMNPQRTIR